MKSPIRQDNKRLKVLVDTEIGRRLKAQEQEEWSVTQREKDIQFQRKSWNFHHKIELQAEPGH